MDRKKLLIHLVVLIFFIFAVNATAYKFYWYSEIWWFDMVLHFMGGVWLGLFFIHLFFHEYWSFDTIFKIILGVLLVGIFWEIYEIFVNDYITRNPFNTRDTISDICLDLAGGLFAILYYTKNIMFPHKNTLQS